MVIISELDVELPPADVVSMLILQSTRRLVFADERKLTWIIFDQSVYNQNVYL